MTVEKIVKVVRELNQEIINLDIDVTDYLETNGLPVEASTDGDNWMITVFGLNVLNSEEFDCTKECVGLKCDRDTCDYEMEQLVKAVKEGVRDTMYPMLTLGKAMVDKGILE